MMPCVVFVREPVSAVLGLPPHKTLFAWPSRKRLPIGHLNNQFFASAYLNVLDLFVKHHLKCRHYLRFIDDFVLL